MPKNVARENDCCASSGPSPAGIERTLRCGEPTEQRLAIVKTIRTQVENFNGAKLGRYEPIMSTAEGGVSRDGGARRSGRAPLWEAGIAPEAMTTSTIRAEVPFADDARIVAITLGAACEE